MRQAVDDFDFHTIATELNTFCSGDLSAFYFDIRKDAIYCDAPGSLRRRAARTVMAEVFSFLTAWLAPITCFHRGRSVAPAAEGRAGWWGGQRASACLPDHPQHLARPAAR
ncbi:MAG: class I tRNA ligase family protein [Hyphomicrobium sp.]